MKKLGILFFALVLSFIMNEIKAQTEWTGPIITITKVDSADWTLPANQDALTDNVILTRADNQGLFNIAKESKFDKVGYTSPLDTEWAKGTIADGIETLTFNTWTNTHNKDPKSVLNVNVVLHLITDDIYIDTKLTSWTSNRTGGGYSYERSTDQSLNFNEFQSNDKIKLFPNPASQYIHISGLTKAIKYSIYDILGAEVNTGTISKNDEIDIQNLSKGFYMLTLENGNNYKFIKK
jgi:hypothetical protein